MAKDIHIADDGKTVTISRRLINELLADPEIAAGVARRQAAEGETLEEAVKHLLILGVMESRAKTAPKDGQRRVV